jgi:hypothetical protein
LPREGLGDEPPTHTLGEGIHQMLEQLNLTDDERLVNTPTPAGPTPKEMGTTSVFVPLTQLISTASTKATGQHFRRDTDRKSPDCQE